MANKIRKQGFAGLTKHVKRLKATTLREKFASDPGRFETFSASLDDMLLDYSKGHLDAEAMAALFAFARELGLEHRRDAMWAGEPINTTERRSVMHMALRYFGDDPVTVEGQDVMGEIRAVQARIRDYSDAIRNGGIRGWGGGQFTDVVNIGIGGSDLGPAMVTQALEPYTRKDLRVHYVSNVDGAHIHDTLKMLEPATTLFVIASKTFTTDETMTNARSARSWISHFLGEEAVPAHFAAVSTNLDGCADFGIQQDRIFGFWDWVGGRYSVWSAIGLPVAIAVGYENFEAFLRGAGDMDRHFREAPLEDNLPVILGLIGILYRNGFGYPTHAVLPYDQRLARFPAYLQQQDMESNGKRVTLNGKSVAWDTGAVIWGEPGTNGQHAFYQLLHQGTSVIPCDFLVSATRQEQHPEHQAKLLANCLAQSEALMAGKTEDEVLAELKGTGKSRAEIKALAPHKVFPGNRPSTTILYRLLDPNTLGRLVALYEHKVFVQGVLWNINSFDQWGVELGKQLAKTILPEVDGDETGRHDASTLGLLAHYHSLKG